MRWHTPKFRIPMAVLFAGGMAVTGLGQHAAPEVTVIGGPCEDCELVFVEMPAELKSDARIASPDEKGETLIVEGTVRKLDGTPARDVVVYAYHTDASGVYPADTTRHGRLRGWARTDAAGRYRFVTIRPGAYPAGNVPQHIHMHVIEPGRGTYFIDDLLFDDDPLQTRAYRSDGTSARGGSGLTSPARDAEGRWQIRRDITLGKNIPRYGN